MEGCNLLKKDIELLVSRLKDSENILVKINRLIQISENNEATLEEKYLASQLADEVLRDAFKCGFGYNIPGTFLDTELGKLLFRMKYDVGEREFNLSEVGKIIGVSRQRVGQLIKENKLEYRIEKNKKVVGYSDLMKYIGIHTDILVEEADKIMATMK